MLNMYYFLKKVEPQKMNFENVGIYIMFKATTISTGK